MGTLLVITGLGTIVFWIAVIAFLITIFIKDKSLCKFVLLAYVIITALYGFACGFMAVAESNIIYGHISFFDKFIGFTKIFLSTFLIANIPSPLMIIFYKESP